MEVERNTGKGRGRRRDIKDNKEERNQDRKEGRNIYRRKTNEKKKEMKNETNKHMQIYVIQTSCAHVFLQLRGMHNKERSSVEERNRTLDIPVLYSLVLCIHSSDDIVMETKLNRSLFSEQDYLV
jgi:hypothetical protein